MAQQEKEVPVGRVFGLLTVTGPDPERPNNWLCKCRCGAETSVQKRHLLSGHTKSCGCLLKIEGANRALDLTGRRFGRLVALAPTDKRRKTSVIWRCRCDCGRETECESEALTRGHVQSCGCLREDQRKANMAKAIHFVDGTCVEKIACQREIATNTSGHRGVTHLKSGRWRATMDFRRKRYDLGTYGTFEEAVAARLEGEKMYQNFLADYYENKASGT